MRLGRLALVALLSTSGCGYIGAALVLTSSGGGSSGGGGKNAPPVVSLDPVARQDGDIPIDYVLSDVNGNAADITVEYGTVPYPGSGSPTVWTPCTEAGGDGTTGLPTSKGGRSHVFIWDAATDLGDGVTYDAAYAQVRITPRDAAKAHIQGNPQATTTFVAGNNVPTVALDPGLDGSVQSGLIQVDYVLSDSTDDPADIGVEFSTDSGGSFAPATVPVGGVADLPSSLAGTPHNFVWDSLTDGVGNSNTIRIRVTPTDALTVAGQEVSDETADFSVQNNTPPITFIAGPGAGEVIGHDVDITYLLLDNNSDLIDITVDYSTDSGVTFAPATESTDPLSEGTAGLSSSPSGDQHLFIWDSYGDAPDLDLPGATPDTVQIRITAFDTGPGLPATVSGLRLDNNEEPTATVSTPSSPQVGGATVAYTLFDVESDTSGVTAEYSTNGGADFSPLTILSTDEGTIAGNAISGQSTLPGGVAHDLLWDTDTDLTGLRIPNVVVRIGPTDNGDPALGAGPRAWTDVFTVDNTVAPTATIDPIPSPASGTVLVSYTLLDTEGDAISIDVGFSTDGGSVFSPATRNTTLGDDVVGLTSSPGGIGHVYAWESLADLGPALESSVVIRITPRDTKGGAPADSGGIIVDNNDAPVAIVDTPAGVQSGNVIIAYTLFDTNSDPVDIGVEWSTDGGATYASGPATECVACTSPASDGIAGLASSPVGTGHIFIWDSIADAGLAVTNGARIRITPSDSLTGVPAESGTFTVDNGTLVPIALGDPMARAYNPDVTVTYRLLDGNASPADVEITYSTDGVTFNPVTTILSTDEGAIAGNIISGQSTSSGGVPHDLVWDSATDLGAGAVMDVQVRIRPSDIDGPGAQDTTNPFIRGNDAPAVAIIAPGPASTDGGLVRIEVDLADSTSDPTDLLVEYSTDGGTSFAGATITVGSTVDLPTSSGGILHTLAWNSVVDLGSQDVPGVVLQITPTDDEPLSGSTASVTFDIQNNDLPVSFIGAPSAGEKRDGNVAVSHIVIDGNSDPITITVHYSVDGGASWLDATLLNPDEGTVSLNTISGISSSPDGIGHSFDWDSGTDLGAQDTDMARIRITPDDGNPGAAFATADFLVDNNQEPLLNTIDPFPPGDRSGAVPVSYTLSDTESDTCTVAVTYSTDGGGTFLPGTLMNPDEGTVAGNEISGLSSSAPGLGHSFEWDTSVDLPGVRALAVVLRIEPRDHGNPLLGQGTGNQTPTFVVDNTSAPSISNLAETGSTGLIRLDYDLLDAEPPTGPTVDIEVTFSTDSGATWSAATIESPDEGTVIGNRIEGQTPNSAHQFWWDSLTDIGPTDLVAVPGGVRMRLVPMDTKVGAPAEIDFDVLNNEAPEVLITDIIGVQSRDVNISYRLRDSYGDTLDIIVQYRVGGVGSFTSATESSDILSEGTTGLTSGPAGAEPGHLFIWDSLADVSTVIVTDVEIRIIATDPFTTGPASISNLFTVDNSIHADLVLGQDGFEQGSVDGRGMTFSGYGLDTDGIRMIVPDERNNRVLILNSVPTSNFQTADVVVGQKEFTTSQGNLEGPSASSLFHPRAAHSDGTKLYVCDSWNHRVLIWDSIPTANFTPADHVLGQGNFSDTWGNRGGSTGQDTLNGPWGITSGGGRLFVSDAGNHRVLVWDLPIDFSSEGPPADHVLGQADFTSNQANRGLSPPSGGTLNGPRSLYADGTTLFVADTFNHRVLQWNQPISFATEGPAAQRVLGQAGMDQNQPNRGGARAMDTLSSPYGVCADANNTYVADSANHRILVWSSPAPASSTAANVVLGQPDGTSGTSNNGGSPAANNMAGPNAVSSTGTELLIRDQSNHRVKIHLDIVGTPLTDFCDAQVVWGQEEWDRNLPNHGEVNSRSFRLSAGIASDGTKLFVADTDNQRVMIWNTLPQVNNKNADRVLGRSDFTGQGPSLPIDSRFQNPSDVAYDPAGNGRLFVADAWNNRVVVFDGPFSTVMAGSVFIGQPDSSSTGFDTGANRFYYPNGVAYDATHGLWVADQRNHRVLRFSSPFTTDMDADLVLGQPDFTSNLRNHGSDNWQPLDPGPVDGDQSLNRPQAVECTGSHVIVIDRSNHRALIWDPVPAVLDAEASLVIGQPNFKSNVQATTRDRFRYPMGVESDGTKLLIADGSNNRILIWDTFPTVNGQDADRMIGQPDYTSSLANNGGISTRSLFTGTSGDQWEWTEKPALLESGGVYTLWFPDQRNNRVLRYDVTP